RARADVAADVPGCAMTGRDPLFFLGAALALAALRYLKSTRFFGRPVSELWAGLIVLGLILALAVLFLILRMAGTRGHGTTRSDVLRPGVARAGCGALPQVQP